MALSTSSARTIEDAGHSFDLTVDRHSEESTPVGREAVLGEWARENIRLVRHTEALCNGFD